MYLHNSFKKTYTLFFSLGISYLPLFQNSFFLDHLSLDHSFLNSWLPKHDTRTSAVCFQFCYCLVWAQIFIFPLGNCTAIKVWLCNILCYFLEKFALLLNERRDGKDQSFVLTGRNWYPVVLIDPYFFFYIFFSWRDIRKRVSFT